MNLPSDSLTHHGNLLGHARDEARRWGWDAEIAGEDEDHDSTGPIPKPDPGAGFIVLRRNRALKEPFQVSVPYHLPESPSQISDAVRHVIETKERSPLLRDRDR